MNSMEATKVYIRFRNFGDIGEHPEIEQFDCAMRGFRDLNVEIKPYYWIDEIDDMELSPETVVVGYVGDVFRALKKMNKPLPQSFDYPEQLAEYVGRKIIKTTLGQVRDSTEKVFIKPINLKEFRGFVWSADAFSRLMCVASPDETPVWASEMVDFVSEYRSFILYNKLIGCRFYKGDWFVVPDRNVVESGVKKMGKHAPHAYCLDWGVTAEGETLLIEGNDSFAMGPYGLQSALYARMLSARWFELTK